MIRKILPVLILVLLVSASFIWASVQVDPKAPPEIRAQEFISSLVVCLIVVAVVDGFMAAVFRYITWRNYFFGLLLIAAAVLVAYLFFTFAVPTLP